MRIVKVVFISLIQILIFNTSAIAATDYDGKYNAFVSCGKSTYGAEPFDLNNSKLVVRNGGLTSPAFKLTTYIFSGTVSSGGFNITANASNENKTEKYELRFNGRVDGKDTIVGNGEFANNGEKRRDCKLILTLIESDSPKIAGNGPITTQAPQPVPAQNGFPARSAAIGNVAVSTNLGFGQVTPNQPMQVTTNSIDLQKKTNPNEVWISFNPSITVQQRQFCRIIENFRTENSIAQQTQNQIKVNQTFRNLVQSLVALLPDGKFQGWVMRTVYVSQASNGDAEVLLELPCNVYVGSNACDANPNNFYGTAPENSRIYTELAKMTVGDFAITSGKFLYADEKAFDKARSVASFTYMKAANHCRAKKIASDADFFGLSVETMSTIK